MKGLKLDLYQKITKTKNLMIFSGTVTEIIYYAFDYSNMSSVAKENPAPLCSSGNN